MLLAADLHLHSRHADAVSPQMTMENIAHWAQRKGLDLLVTGDCLQPGWRTELADKLVEAEPGFLVLKPSIERAVSRELLPHLRRPLRYVVGTEVCCAPPGTPKRGGIHHLIYFPSLDSADRFARKAARYGDLGAGRPDLSLTSRELLEFVLEHGDHSHLIPAHIFNPWYSAFGSVSGGKTLADLFDDLASHIFAVETGLTSTPLMCRRVSSLDGVGLVSSSDAHSLENIGRECTLLEIEPSYEALFAALRMRTGGPVTGTLKFPLERTRYYRNRCSHCEQSFAAHICPQCGNRLTTGSHDQLEIVADRIHPLFPAGAPAFHEVLPLTYVIAEFMGVKPKHKQVGQMAARLVSAVGNERFILTEASPETLERESVAQLARALVRQRTESPGGVPLSKNRKDVRDENLQLPFDL